MVETLVRRRYACARGIATSTGAAPCEAEAVVEQAVDDDPLPEGWYWHDAPAIGGLRVGKGRLSCPRHAGDDGVGGLVEIIRRQHGG